MDRIKQLAIEDLRRSREDLLSIRKGQLSFDVIYRWLEKWASAFRRAETIKADLIVFNIQRRLAGFESVQDIEAFNELRGVFITYLDEVIVGIDKTQVVKPILDELISKVKDTKLSMLLLEFNRAKDINPNLAALGFRTILALIIIERAKIVAPQSPLATRGDISFEREIKEALSSNPPIFSSGEQKLLKRHLTGGEKDRFDNVAHKLGDNAIINKDDLNDGVSLLISLLPTIL